MKQRFYQFDFTRGLQTTHSEDGLDLPDHIVFQNARVRTRSAKRRAGFKRVQAITAAASNALQFNGSDHYLYVGVTTIHTFGKAWTLETLVKPDTVTGTQAIVAFDHATVYPLKLYLDGSTLKCDVIDSASATVTLSSTSTYSGGDLMAIQVKRNGTALTLTVNGVEEDTDTMADLVCLETSGSNMLFGKDGAGSPNWYDGGIDYIRMFSVARSSADDGNSRFLDPRAEYVLFDYNMQIHSDDRCYDRSRHEFHALPAGATNPAALTPALHNRGGPLQGVYPYRNRSGAKRVCFVHNSTFYNARVD